ncbi:hypothetical protein [Oryza sativa Japonica Group]|uniref:Uncharacterized protein n=1 Tax=Oryza sativa subsp. japonica TaxID=39947 RepID=Q5ZEF7_ORYSJ|nr:hypothetical protein [Oryza sativa Japonica Group]
MARPDWGRARAGPTTGPCLGCTLVTVGRPGTVRVVLGRVCRPWAGTAWLGASVGPYRPDKPRPRHGRPGLGRAVPEVTTAIELLATFPYHGAMSIGTEVPWLAP